MALLLNTIRSFPRGRTLQELQALVGNSFDANERLALIAELGELVKSGQVRRLSSGKWVPVNKSLNKSEPSLKPNEGLRSEFSSEHLIAVPFVVRGEPLDNLEFNEDDDQFDLDPSALLRYYRSALRADPRGSLEENIDRHGQAWQLIHGQNRLVPSDDGIQKIRIELSNLAPDFRTALLQREANENALAIGWPICVGRKSGMPVIWPVGLIAATWKRVDGELHISVETDDILVNPDWVKGAARNTVWRRDNLAAVFEEDGGVGLEKEEFRTRLAEAAAPLIMDDLQSKDLSRILSLGEAGIFNMAGLFLPDESSFTIGAIRDLDVIATWRTEQIQRTALAPLLGLAPKPSSKVVHPLNIGPLNAEQIDAVRKASVESLTVVTGPPGTGKSQTIVSMVASVLAAGGSVLVASKNHQALDAVQDRLGAIAEDVPFLIRTLDPVRGKDVSFDKVLDELVNIPTKAHRLVDEHTVNALLRLASERTVSIDYISKRSRIECELADINDQIKAKAQLEKLLMVAPDAVEPVSLSLFFKIRRYVLQSLKFWRSGSIAKITKITKFETLEQRLARLRSERNNMGELPDVVGQTETIANATRQVLPLILLNRTNVNLETLEVLEHQNADYKFNKGQVPSSLAHSVVQHRPLWLASILGTPKRIPLEPGLFDLVIFDEASQCDIGSALPLFARAKRAVVVGDSRQLNFIAQIGQAQDRNLMQAQGLPVDKMSKFAQSKQALFDFARRTSGAQKVLLKQQYRSVGPIVDYISTNFYGGELKTAYDPKTIRAPKSQRPGIAWTDVPSPLVHGQNNSNAAEVAAIVNHIEKLLIIEEYDGSIGVVTPFRGQVVAIEIAVKAKIPTQKLEEADFRVATVDGFQGQERDVILFSPTLGAASRSTAITFVQRDVRRLNVAISRARAVAHVFGDLTFARSGKVRPLASLAAAATDPPKRSGEGDFDSEWERKVYYALIERGLSPEPQYEIAGRRLDFALFGAGDIKLDLEVDGRKWHQNADGSRKISDYWRDHQLKSLGWRVRRFWVDELATDLEACLDIIEQDLS